MTDHSAERPTLGAGLRGTDNSFGIIRLVLASAVIFSHAFYLSGWRHDPTLGYSRGQETIGGWAVVGFFIVSGYLITKSGERNDVMQFLWRRALRIFPAFWAVLLVAALVVGPIAWWQMDRPLSDYSLTGPGGPLSYVISNSTLTINQWGIYDIFKDTTPWGQQSASSVFNGSLWTLAYEWRAYLIIAALVLVGALRRAKMAVIACLAVVYAMAVTLQFAPEFVASLWPAFNDRFAITLTLAFLLGASMSVLADRIVLNRWVALTAVVTMGATLLTSGWVLIGYPAFAYLVLYLAARLPAFTRRIGAKNDYSYGMYVYGFLVQQLTASWGWHLWGYVPWVAATLLLTAICAVLSWHLVEKPALTAKNWGPGRGIAYWRKRLVRVEIKSGRRHQPAES